MTKQKKYIFGNWKLNPKTALAASQLAKKIKKSTKHVVVLFPPTAFLSSVKYPLLGAQDCFWEESGPHTGQVSATQLKSLKVKYCLVGHSEMRSLKETNDMIALKVAALLRQKITPVVCVGFGTQASDSLEQEIQIIKSQVDTVAAVCDIKKIIIAYEPVWAISKGDPHTTKRIPTGEHAGTIVKEIKKDFGVKVVLYGGSVSKDNAQEFLQYTDGLLIGGASLKPDEFNKILK